MNLRSQVDKSYWNDSKHLFFAPKLSLQGKNLFPQIGDINNIHSKK